jgi:hypothetical protein
VSLFNFLVISRRPHLRPYPETCLHTYTGGQLRTIPKASH